MNTFLLALCVFSCSSEYGSESTISSRATLTTDSVISEKRMLANRNTDTLLGEVMPDTIAVDSNNSTEHINKKTTSFVEGHDTIYIIKNIVILFYYPNQEQYETVSERKTGQSRVDFNTKMNVFFDIANEKACYHLDSSTCKYIHHFDDAKYLSLRVDTGFYIVDGGSIEDYYGYVIYKQGCAPKHVSMPALPMGAEKLIAEDIIEYFNSCK